MKKSFDERGIWYILTYPINEGDNSKPDSSGPFSYLIEAERAMSRAMGTGRFYKVEMLNEEEFKEFAIENNDYKRN